MKNKNKMTLKDLKSEFLNTEVPNSLKLAGWDEISRKIDARKEARYVYTKTFGFLAALVVVISLGLCLFIQGVAASEPGDFLYQVKVLGEKVIKKHFVVITDSVSTPIPESDYFMEQSPEPENIETPNPKKIKPMATPIATPIPTSLPSLLPSPLPLPDIKQIIQAIPSLIPTEAKSWFSLNLFK